MSCQQWESEKVEKWEDGNGVKVSHFSKTFISKHYGLLDIGKRFCLGQCNDEN